MDGVMHLSPTGVKHVHCGGRSVAKKGRTLLVKSEPLNLRSIGVHCSTQQPRFLWLPLSDARSLSWAFLS
jgi:hypothetical protein